jgi:tetratricopeptide (TPR) repeat protein
VAAGLIAMTWPALADTAQIRDALRRREFGAAVEACDRQLQQAPGDFQTWTLKGVALQMMGRAPDALGAFRKALSLQPKYLPALQAAAQLEYATKDPNCRRTLASLLELQPENKTAYAMLGVLAYERRDCDTAVRSFETAGPELTANPVTEWQYGACLFALGRAADAAVRFRQLLNRKEDPEVRYNLALSLYEAKQFDDALAAIEPLAGAGHPDADSLALAGLVWEAKDRTPDAIATFRRALDLYPRQERLYLDLASICYDHNAVELGIEILQTGIRNLPGAVRLHATLGLFLTQLGRTAEAEAVFERSMQLAPEASYGAVSQSATLLDSGDPAASIRILRAQLARNPKSAKTMALLARSLLQTTRSPGDAQFEEARKLLENSLALQPSDARAAALLGKCYFAGGDLARAIGMLDRALRLDPDDRTSAYQLMMCYRRTGSTDKAAHLEARVRELLASEKRAERDRDRYRLMKAAPAR